MENLGDDVIGLILSAVTDETRDFAAKTEAAYKLSVCSKPLRDAAVKWARPLAKMMDGKLGSKYVLFRGGSPETRPIFVACREAHVSRVRIRLSCTTLRLYPARVKFHPVRANGWSFDFYTPDHRLYAIKETPIAANLHVRLAILDKHGRNTHTPFLFRTHLDGVGAPPKKYLPHRGNYPTTSTIIDFEYILRIWDPDPEKARYGKLKFLSLEELLGSDIPDAKGNIMVEVYILEYPSA